jgi:outer membrane autotransporter protein
MHKNNTSRLSPGRKTILAVAVAATLLNGSAHAVDQNIVSNTGHVTWTEDNVTIAPGIKVSTTDLAGVLIMGTPLGTLTNSGTISNSTAGINSDFSNALVTIGTITNNASGVIESDANAIKLTNPVGTKINLIDNKGLITGARANTGSYFGSVIAFGGAASTIGTLNNSGTISSSSNVSLTSGTVFGGTVISNSALINELTNSGLVSSHLINAGNAITKAGDGIYNSGSIGSLSNTSNGVIQSTSSTSPQGHLIAGAGVANQGVINFLLNDGLISSDSGTINGPLTGQEARAIGNNGTIFGLTNNGTLSGAGLNAIGVLNTGRIDRLSNGVDATISGNKYGLQNLSGSIGTLNNTGLITGDDAGVSNGTYSGPQGTITTLNNLAGGTISGAVGIENNAGTIGLLNNAGLISGSSSAIWNYDTLGAINNSGTIAGDIGNSTSNDLVINGATGSAFGVLTGYSAGQVGQIFNTQSDVRFNSGNLLLNDNINLGSLNGTLFTAQNNGATLQINNGINISGNYTQAADASLLFGVADGAVATGDPVSDAGYGRLYVNGSVTLASGTRVGLTSTGSAYSFAQGQRYMVLGAEDGSHSNFNEGSLNYSLNATGLTLTGQNVAITGGATGANALVLTVVGANGASNAINGASTSDARSSLNGLFSYQGTDPQLMNLARAGAAMGSTGSANNGGAQLSPTSTAAAASTASTATTHQVFEVAGNRMDSLRTAQAGNGSSGLSSGDASGTAGGLWGQAFGGSSRQDEREDIAGYHANYHGMLIGADADLNDSWRAGGLFSYSNTSVNNDGANKHNSADIDSYGLIAYATYTANPWYVNLSAGAIQHQYDTKRQVSLTGFDGTAKGNYDGMQYLAAAQAGYPIDLGSKTTLTPIAGLTYSTLKQDSYTEKGGNGAGLHVASDDIDSLKSDLGAKLERSFATSYGELIPAAQLTWRHEFRDEGLRSVANFSADVAGETSFSTNGPSAINDTGVLSLGATLVRSNRVSLSAKYTLEAGSGYTANTGNLQVRWDF